MEVLLYHSLDCNSLVDLEKYKPARLPLEKREEDRRLDGKHMRYVPSMSPEVMLVRILLAAQTAHVPFLAVVPLQMLHQLGL